MGKRKIESYQKINSNRTRTVTLCKRREGLIKKAMQLSLLCDVEVTVLIYSRDKNRLVTFESHSEKSPLKELTHSLLSISRETLVRAQVEKFCMKDHKHFGINNMEEMPGENDKDISLAA